MKTPAIIGSWVHAHERDKSGVRFYVEAGQPLGPSRGRQELTFHRDGTFVESSPGSDDRPAHATGTYQLNGNRLVLNRSSDTPVTIYEVLELSGEKGLQMKRL